MGSAVLTKLLDVSALGTILLSVGMKVGQLLCQKQAGMIQASLYCFHRNSDHGGGLGV